MSGHILIPSYQSDERLLEFVKAFILFKANLYSAIEKHPMYMLRKPG